MAEEQIEELKLREDTDGAVIVGEEDPPPAKVEEEDDEDDRVKASDESHDDEEGHAEETDEERAARTERNRERRKQNKERRKDYIESLKRDLAAKESVINDMNQRLAIVERKSSGSEMAQLDAAEKEAVQYYNHFKTMSQQAIEQANGALATDAQEKMFAAHQRLQQIQNIKKAMSNQQRQPQSLDPRLKANAESWMQENNWYDPNGGDRDSKRVLMLDKELSDEGWDPTTPHYWEELSVRVKEIMPHRANQGYNKSVNRTGTAPRVPVAGSGRESSGGKPTGGYRLSSDRVQALKDSGIWDDPKQRAESIKRYQAYDKAQGATK